MAHVTLRSGAPVSDDKLRLRPRTMYPAGANTQAPFVSVLALPVTAGRDGLR